jgi:hypothetical protein
MTNDDGAQRRMVYLGSFEGGTDIVVNPEPTLARASAQLDAERAAREMAEAKGKLATMQSARANGRLRKALAAVFGRRMK